MKQSLLIAAVLATAVCLAQDAAPAAPTADAPSPAAVRMRHTRRMTRPDRPPRGIYDGPQGMRRMPGLVVSDFGVTADGRKAKLYRIMGQGGVVADFTDYGARLLRAYTPDDTADLANILEGFKPSVIDCEKAGELAEVWKMTPIRRPRATGLVFEREEKGPCVIYWLDAANQLSIESTIADTNAVKWSSSLAVVPLRGRRLEIADSLGTRSLANTTNSVSIALRPGTNVTEKVAIRFTPGCGM